MRAGVSLATGFLATGFLATGFLATGLLATGLLATGAVAQTPVARISVELPQMDQFILQATLPVPPGTFRSQMTTMPLSIRNGGALSTTQVEVVARYPRDTDGASVVEVISRVTRPAGAAPGTEAFFDVVLHDNAEVAHQPGSEASTLLATPGSIVLATRDQHGNRYAADLYRKPRTNAAGTRLLRDGSYLREVRTHEVLTPVGSLNGLQLPHMMGVHATFRTYSNEDFVAVDLHLHNGMDGRDFTTSIDDVVSDLYFDRLDLELPNGWQVIAAYDTTYQGTPIVAAQTTVHPLIASLPDGQLHILPQQSQMSRRYVLARSSAAVDRGRQVLARRNYGFAAPVMVSATVEGWSWWNNDTPSYLPQRNVLPRFDHMDLGGLRSELAARLAGYQQLLATGQKSPQGNYPFASGTLGWANPWGVPYGGMTGGNEVEQWPGTDIFWARSQAGIRLMEIQAQCYDDRQPVALYESSGAPTQFEHMVQATGNHGPWIPTYFNLTPSKDSTYFAFQIADATQAQRAYETFRVPVYEKDIRAYQPIDFQHLTRYLNAWLVLAWMTNDAEAKRALELHSELYRITMSEYYNSNYGHVQGAGLLARMQAAQTNGGKGGNWGRGEAWGLQASLAWFALGTDELRTRYRPWYTLLAQALRDSVSTCTGNLSSLQITKQFKGIYQSRQSTEAAFMLHAVHGLRRSVFEGVNQQLQDELAHVVNAGAHAAASPPYWSAQHNAQYRIVATRLFDDASPDFCSSVPEDGYSDDDYNHWSALTTWAYAYNDTRDTTLLARTAEAIGGANALAQLESEGFAGIADKAPMLALLQLLAP
ncbi:MAG: hypothetical protein R3F49_01535 [Planctomycetota bacterium]